MKVTFDYPLFCLNGDEHIITVTADVDFAHEAQRDEYGRETKCSTGDDVNLIDVHFEEGSIFAKFDVEALPKAILKQIEDMAIEAAKEQVEYEQEQKSDYFIWTAQAADC